MADQRQTAAERAELELLHRGLVAPGDLDARTLEAIRDRAREASLLPLDLLVREGALSGGAGRTLQAIAKGYMRAPLEPLFAGFVAPQPVSAASAQVLEVPEVPEVPEPLSGSDGADGVEGEVAGAGQPLGPMPEWGTTEDSVAIPVKPPMRPRSTRGPRRRPAIDPLALGDAPSVGEQIDGFTLRELLSTSGATVTYRAYDEREKRSTLIKILRSEVLSRERERFFSEGRILSRLSHPNIVELVCCGEHRGAPYIVLEQIFAIGLDEHIERAPCEDPTFILKVALCASRGLAAAAEAGVIHRDLQPANLLLYDGSGRVKVAGFGLASEADSEQPEGMGTIRGTPAYMAPELVVAAADVDQRADMYGLGVTLYEIATGEVPFIRSTVLETMRAHVRDQPVPVHERRVDFPRPLSALIDRLLRKRPDDRFATWDEVSQAVEELLQEHKNPITDAVTRAVHGDNGKPALTSLYRKKHS